MIKQYFIKYQYLEKYDNTWYKVNIFIVSHNIDNWWERYKEDYYEVEIISITYLGEVNE